MSEQIIYDICRRRTSNASYSLAMKNGEEVVTKSIQVVYRVHVSEGPQWPHTRAINAADVDEEMVRNAPAPPINATFNNTLPVTSKTVYQSPDGSVYYYWRCTAVNVARNPSNGLEFDVTCTFVDPTGSEEGLTPPQSLNDIPSQIKYSYERHEVTAWTEDKTTNPTGDPKPCVLPTGTLYSNPPVRIIGQEIVTLTQYEGLGGVNPFGPQKVLGDAATPGRLYSVNENSWMVDQTPGSVYPNVVDPYHAMIVNIDYEDTTVPLSNGLTDAYRVTYTIAVRNYNLVGTSDEGSATNHELGWQQPRVRADTRCLQVGADKKLMPAANIDAWGGQQVYLKADGTPMLEEYQKGIPPYDILKLQPQINFGFLR